MAGIGTWLLKNWKYIVIGLMAVAIGGLTNALVGSYKANGELTTRLDNEKKATGILQTQLTAAQTAAKDQTKKAGEAYSQCEQAAQDNNSSSFQQGITVGKVLGRKETCDVSSTAAPWPRLSSSPAVPAVPQTPSLSTPAPKPQTPVPARP